MKIITLSLPLSFLMSYLSLIVLCASCSATSPSFLSQQKINGSDSATVDQNMAQELQNLLDDAINRQKIPGLQVSIQFPDGQKWSGVSGSVTPERRQPLQNDDLLRIGSATKLYTATLVMKLVEQGKLNLSDTLSNWFPEVPNAAQISITQLLNHTSGLAEILESFAPKMKSIFSHKRWKSSELIKIISSQKPHVMPGKDFYYSNSNYILLGLIIEKVCGCSFENFLQSEILLPQQLKSTFLLPLEKAPEGLVTGFDRDLIPWPGTFKIKNDNTAWASLAFTSGAMAGTASDLLAFIERLFNEKILSKNSMSQMTTFADVHDQDKLHWTGYGLGIARFDIYGIEYWGHEGLFIGFESIAIYCPANSYFITMIGNVSSFDKIEIVRKLQAIIDRRRTY